MEKRKERCVRKSYLTYPAATRLELVTTKLDILPSRTLLDATYERAASRAGPASPASQRIASQMSLAVPGVFRTRRLC